MPIRKDSVIRYKDEIDVYLDKIDKLQDKLGKLEHKRNTYLNDPIIQNICKEEIEKVKERLDQEIERERECRGKLLYHALMYINYSKHTDHFNSFLKGDSKVGAFLLHGSLLSEKDFYRAYSIRSLLKRLISAIPLNSITPLMNTDLASAAIDVNTVWRELATKLMGGIPKAKIEQKEIIQLLCKRLRTQNIVLVFHGVNNIRMQDLEVLIQKFWGVLASEVAAQRPRKFFLMFLVDNTGTVSNGYLPCIDEMLSDKRTEPERPVRFPMISKYSDQDLSSWMQNWSEHLAYTLPDSWIGSPLEFRISTIMYNSNDGEPDLVIEYICTQCDYGVEGMEICLKL